MGQSVRKANHSWATTLGCMTILFPSLLSCFLNHAVWTCCCIRRMATGSIFRTLKTLRREGESGVRTEWGMGGKTTVIGAGSGAEKWGKDREREKKDLLENPTKIFFDLKRRENVLSYSWRPVISDKRVNLPFLLVTIGRTQLIYACCIILSFQQGKNHWSPILIDARRKGHDPKDMLYKGQVELLWPKVAQTPCGQCVLGERFFAEIITGERKPKYLIRSLN